MKACTNVPCFSPLPDSTGRPHTVSENVSKPPNLKSGSVANAEGQALKRKKELGSPNIFIEHLGHDSLDQDQGYIKIGTSSKVMAIINSC